MPDLHSAFLYIDNKGINFSGDYDEILFKINQTKFQEKAQNNHTILYLHIFIQHMVKIRNRYAKID